MKSRIDLFGTSFILHSDEDNEYIQSLVGYIKSKVDNLNEEIDLTDNLKTSILALLMITHELQTLKNELKSTNNYALSSVKQMLSILDTNASLAQNSYNKELLLTNSNNFGQSTSSFNNQQKLEPYEEN